jgi:hypothetical protein
MSKIKIIIFFGLGLISILFLAWRIIEVFGKRVNHTAILRDVSDSITADCECTKALGERALKEPGRSGESKIWLFATGDQSSDNGPVVKGEFKVPDSKNVMEGKGKVEQERQKVLTELGNKCREMKLTNQSPLYLGVKRVVEHLRSQGCKAGSECTLYVQTDGEELVEGQIRDAINGRQAKDSKSPALIDNTGIRVIFIGLAQTKGGAKRATQRDSQRPERLEDVWKGLFTKPENVKLEPYCPKAETP